MGTESPGGFPSVTITTVSWGPMTAGLLGLTVLSKHLRMWEPHSFIQQPGARGKP